jgi:Asp-tRNA(Asn)/Glu-tRNA(Gln) amidotransferase C subunit
MDFLFHNLSEKEKEEIKKQVDTILNSFSAKLSKLDKKEDADSFVEREECERKEGGEQDKSFSRETMFKNAPEKNKNFIIGEKKNGSCRKLQAYLEEIKKMTKNKITRFFI